MAALLKKSHSPKVAFCVSFILVLSLGLGGGLAIGGGFEATVRFVPDGDTLLLNDGRKVRLLGMDAPEMGKDGEPDQLKAREARLRLKALVEGRVITVVPGPRPHDRYGRVLGIVYAGSGESLNEILVREGLCFVYRFKDDPPEMAKALLRAQRRAILEGSGFWPEILGLPDATTPWTGNARSWRAFPAKSSGARRLSKANRVSLGDLRAVFEKGYSPARKYTPWPLAKQGE